jgi:T4 gene Gp59 loader of gp41 DNA helicase/T4 gene Gp59 loader of gp41 DNA helicase C-term
MIMDDFSVYRMYLALKLHFTTDNYDVIQQKGKVRASKAAFNKRKDLFSIKKIAKTYSDEDVANFLVANFVSGDRWGGMFDSEAGKRFIDWKKRTESLTYLFSTDIDKILLEIEENGVKFEDIFTISKGQHPYIIKAYLRNTITIETLVILDRIIGFVDKFDKNILDEVIWPDISRLIKKYKPFLKIDLEKYDRTLRDKIKTN